MQSTRRDCATIAASSSARRCASTRLRMSTLLPTYSGSVPSPLKMYTPALRGKAASVLGSME